MSTDRYVSPLSCLLYTSYGICEKSDSVLVEGQELAPWEILAQFLQGMLKFLGVAELVKNTKCVAVTLPGLTEIQVENFQKAFEIIGFPHEKYMLLDYGESFYYYVLSQKRETWNRSVGWYAFCLLYTSFSTFGKINTIYTPGSYHGGITAVADLEEIIISLDLLPAVLLDSLFIKIIFLSADRDKSLYSMSVFIIVINVSAGFVVKFVTFF